MQKKRKFLINLILLILATTILFAQEEKIKPIEVKSFTEFFDKFHIGMRAEEVLKLFDNKLKLKLVDTKEDFSGLEGLEIYEIIPFEKLISYKGKKYDLYFLIYKHIIFTIRFHSFSLEYPDDFIGELISFEDYESIKKDFDSNKKYEKIFDNINTPENLSLKSGETTLAGFAKAALGMLVAGIEGTAKFISNLFKKKRP